MVDSIGRAGATEGRLVPPWYLIFFFGALAALGPLSIDAYLPGIPAMASDFGVTVVSLQNTLNVFLVGYAIGQFFGGALSDQIGRKLVGYTGLSVYLVSSIAIAFAGTRRRDAGAAVLPSHRRRFFDGRSAWQPCATFTPSSSSAGGSRRSRWCCWSRRSSLPRSAPPCCRSVGR